MFVISNKRELNRAKVTEEIERLHRLAADLGALRDGHGPTAADLSSAPILDHWTCASAPALRLIGLVSDHPLLPGAGRPIVTSDLWVLAEDQGWARTRSRWYRLGQRRAPLGRIS
ncbi:DUF6634 family protein [Microvirga sp. M2]|uniref:DUF6634 family protein n=1 Tax=Microvirga sp. M2 TaxID=3073270 RepID=UPI0039C48DA7